MSPAITPPPPCPICHTNWNVFGDEQYGYTCGTCEQTWTPQAQVYDLQAERQKRLPKQSGNAPMYRWAWNEIAGVLLWRTNDFGLPSDETMVEWKWGRKKEPGDYTGFVDNDLPGGDNNQLEIIPTVDSTPQAALAAVKEELARQAPEAEIVLPPTQEAMGIERNFGTDGPRVGAAWAQLVFGQTTSFRQRRPYIYVPEHDRIFWGPEGSEHSELFQDHVLPYVGDRGSLDPSLHRHMVSGVVYEKDGKAVHGMLNPEHEYRQRIEQLVGLPVTDKGEVHWFDSHYATIGDGDVEDWQEAHQAPGQEASEGAAHPQGQVEVWWPSLDDAVEIAQEAVDDYQGFRDPGLVESAIAATRMAAQYAGLNDPFEIAATLMDKLQRQQGLVDGNKRTALIVGLYFLEMNGWETGALPQEQLAEMMLAVAERCRAPEDLSSFLRQYCTPLDRGVTSSRGSTLTRKVADADLEGAMVALFIPDDPASQLLLKDGEPIENMHITLAYFDDKADDRDDWEGAEQIVAGWAKRTKPLTGEISGYGVFQNGEQDVLWAAPSVPGLADLRHDLVEELERAGFKVSDEHGWQPHVTLKYYDDGFKDELPLLEEPIELDFDKLTFAFGADKAEYEFDG